MDIYYLESSDLLRASLLLLGPYFYLTLLGELRICAEKNRKLWHESMEPPKTLF